jgi:hypothetical protein
MISNQSDVNFNLHEVELQRQLTSKNQARNPSVAGIWGLLKVISIPTRPQPLFPFQNYLSNLGYGLIH